MGTRALFALLTLAACMSPAPRAPTATPTAIATATANAIPTATPPAPPPAFGSEEADQILFADASDADARASCLRDLPEPERVACLLRVRYRADPAASALALAMHAQSGNIAGVQPERMFDGGYRGTLKFVPALPIHAARAHLAWVVEAFRDYERLFAGLAARASGARSSASASEPAFRWRALSLRFFRSVNARTPSAYAQGWTIGYNLGGSLNVSEEWVRETLFHELFHLNDEFHGDWAVKELSPIREAIMKRCGASTPCLRPYAPSPTIVSGSTFYAFHPPNPVTEYGGELALRYYREQRAVLRGEPIASPFKCGPPENARAWELLVKEFFAAIDLVPPCAK